MIEETAQVVATAPGLARVEIIKTSSCNSCHANGVCGTAAVSRFFNFRAPQVEVDNQINARTGDTVSVAINDDTMLKGSFLLYLAPLLSLLLFALLADYVAANEGIIILAGLSGLAIGLVIVKQLSVKLMQSVGKARIINVLSSAGLQVAGPQQDSIYKTEL
ncbi:MAG: SoxR reducing system RseC family protein [Chromatiales bacterium]